MNSALVLRTSSYTCAWSVMTSRRRRRKAATGPVWALRRSQAWTTPGVMMTTEPVASSCCQWRTGRRR